MSEENVNFEPLATKDDIYSLVGHAQSMHRVLMELSIITLKHSKAPKSEIDELMTKMAEMVENFSEVLETIRIKDNGEQ